MNKTGYITLWNADCVFCFDNNDIIVIPKNKDDIYKMNSHFNDNNFIVNFEQNFGCYTAYIDRVEFGINGAIKLIPKYLIGHYHKEFFSGFEITGESIDDFFCPARYFYDRKKKDTEASPDLVYNREVADKWNIVFENTPITITLSYGDILRWGTGSDLMLHPKLTITFDSTNDIQFVYRVFKVIIRFLRIIRYDTKCGKFQIDLSCEDNGKLSYNGRLYDYCVEQLDFSRSINDVEYGCYKPYVQRFLQFAADNPDYNFDHYPSDGLRYRGRHYSAVDFLNIFSAFEGECHASKKLYENVDVTKIQQVKDSIIKLISEYPNDDLSKEELEFLKNTRENLIRQGTEFGQRKKLKNAYHILRDSLENSIENIFYLPAFKCKGNLSNTNLNKVVEFLVGQRGAIAHGRFLGSFSDEDAQKIHFLEILTYAQTLKRVGLDDKDIERVIGVVFLCNYVVSQERHN